ncbi:MAG: hypothetical protein JWN38_312 [Candidatus Saccharibacteria bacterium]|nr:hypothetical protein [Candidatus Saccharibacteria bacterium]
MQPTVEPLTDRPVTPLLEEQLRYFTTEAMHVQPVMEFIPEKAAERLGIAEGTRLLGADFGGDKGAVRLFKIQNGQLVTQDDYKDDIQGDNGAGYLDTIKRAAAFAAEQGIPLGISWGAPLDGTKPLYHPKAKTFLEELQAEFGGDMAAISPSITSVVNDGPAGAIAGAMAAYQQTGADNVIFVINGGGLGSSIILNGTLYAAEAGHVEGIEALNTYHQTEPCGVYNATYVCLERLGANKAGIEAQWQAETGSYMRARDIEDRYKEGNQLAADLYEHSAEVVAHIIQGIADNQGMSLVDGKTAIVAHGGAFKFPHYGERIAQILAAHNDQAIELLMTKDFGAADSNACLDGSAIAALYASN